MKPNRNDSVGQQSAAEDALCKALTSLDSVEDCRHVLRDLCTPGVLQALVDRWQVVEFLEPGLTYRTIHDQTGVSVTTIRPVARFLTDGFGGYRAAIDSVSALDKPTSH